MKELLYKYGVIYFGTVCLMVGPYFIQLPIGKILSVVGLALLTVQTQRTKSYNLSLLNVVGIGGYIFSLYKQFTS
tara:strand:- start:23628 stop:23852 length:225 start_codon:yes stop_codon:yes gene_type:complete